MSIWEWICSTLCSRCDLETMGKICTLQNGAPCLAYEDDIISAPITQLQQENGLEMLTTMNAERDPFILKLPSEKIASHVFLLSMGERDIQDVCKSGVRLPTPFLLGAVCSGWRALARSTPELWSKLAYTSHDITSLKNQRNTPQLIADWLVRSGSLPLTLRMSKGLEAYNGYFHPSDYDDGWKLIIDILNLHSECWCDVDFELPTNYIAALRGTSPPKNLRKLSFSSLNVYSPTNFFLRFTMNTAPSPMKVSIYGFHLDNINVSWDNLVDLELNYITLDGVMKVLRQAPLLETCSLTDILPPADGFPTTLGTINRHPKIQTLFVSWTDTEIFTELLDWLVLPSLEWCELYAYCGDKDRLPLGTVVSFINRSGCSLELLDLWYTGLKPSGDEQAPMSEDMERLLRTVPHLRHRFDVKGLTCYR